MLHGWAIRVCCGWKGLFNSRLFDTGIIENWLKMIITKTDWLLPFLIQLKWIWCVSARSFSIPLNLLGSALLKWFSITWAPALVLCSYIHYLTSCSLLTYDDEDIVNNRAPLVSARSFSIPLKPLGQCMRKNTQSISTVTRSALKCSVYASLLRPTCSSAAAGKAQSGASLNRQISPSRRELFSGRHATGKEQPASSILKICRPKYRYLQWI